MIKVIRIALAGVFATVGAVYAGSIAYLAPVEPMIVEETGSMGGSGMWLIPLLAIALIALVVSSNNNGSQV